jgi:hypothetical protein
LTNIIKITVMTFLMLAVADRHAQAAEPTVITLSCDGKLTNTKVRNAKQESITKMDLVVNFAERTVSFSGHLAGIDNADVAHISFSGENNAVHRVTGITWATADTIQRHSSITFFAASIERTANVRSRQQTRLVLHKRRHTHP